MVRWGGADQNYGRRKAAVIYVCVGILERDNMVFSFSRKQRSVPSHSCLRTIVSQDVDDSREVPA